VYTFDTCLKTAKSIVSTTHPGWFKGVFVLEIFGVNLKLIESTSPVPGKLCASVLDAAGKVMPDMFMHDPKGDFTQYDEGEVDRLLHQAFRAKGGFVPLLLGVCRGAIATLDGIRRLFGGSYSGSLGVGNVGQTVSMASAFMSIVAWIFTTVLKAPFSLVAGVVQWRLKSQFAAEKAKLIEQVQVFFASLQAQSQGA
jgi:hypothetical protein